MEIATLSATATAISAGATVVLVIITGFYAIETMRLRRQNESLATVQREQLSEQRSQLEVQQKQLDLSLTPSVLIVPARHNNITYLLNLSNSDVYVLSFTTLSGIPLRFFIEAATLVLVHETEPCILLEPGKMRKIDFTNGGFAVDGQYRIRLLYGSTGPFIHEMTLTPLT